jgi:hypothetical protein
MVIQLSELERRRVRDGLLIHNHPPELDLPPDDPRHDSASLSDLDILWARDHDLAAIIAVSPTWRHELIRPLFGWEWVLPTAAEFEDSLKLLYDAIQLVDAKRVDLGETSFEQAAATRSHRVNEQFSREIGAFYRRERR